MWTREQCHSWIVHHYPWYVMETCVNQFKFPTLQTDSGASSRTSWVSKWARGLARTITNNLLYGFTAVHSWDASPIPGVDSSCQSAKESQSKLLALLCQLQTSEWDYSQELISPWWNQGFCLVLLTQSKWLLMLDCPFWRVTEMVRPTSEVGKFVMGVVRGRSEGFNALTHSSK